MQNSYLNDDSLLTAIAISTARASQEIEAALSERVRLLARLSLTACASTAIADALAERVRQLAKWGDQSHPCVPWELPGRGYDERFVAEAMERAAKADCEREFKAGRGTWWHIANEELAEVLAAPPEKRREELVQLTAVCLAWLEDLDNKTATTATEDSSS